MNTRMRSEYACTYITFLFILFFRFPRTCILTKMMLLYAYMILHICDHFKLQFKFFILLVVFKISNILLRYVINDATCGMIKSKNSINGLNRNLVNVKLLFFEATEYTYHSTAGVPSRTKLYIFIFNQDFFFFFL